MRQLLLDQQLWAGAAAANRAIAEGVHTLLSILDGSEASLKAAPRTWLELMAAQALHRVPGLATQPSRACARSVCLSLRCQSIKSRLFAPDDGLGQHNWLFPLSYLTDP